MLSGRVETRPILKVDFSKTVIQGRTYCKPKHQATSSEDDRVADQVSNKSTKNQADCQLQAFVCCFDR